MCPLGRVSGQHSALDMSTISAKAACYQTEQTSRRPDCGPLFGRRPSQACWQLPNLSQQIFKVQFLLGCEKVKASNSDKSIQMTQTRVVRVTRTAPTHTTHLCVSAPTVCRVSCQTSSNIRTTCLGTLIICM